MQMTLEERKAHALAANENAYRKLREAEKAIRSIVPDLANRRMSEDWNSLSNLVANLAGMVEGRSSILGEEFLREATAN